MCGDGGSMGSAPGREAPGPSQGGTQGRNPHLLALSAVALGHRAGTGEEVGAVLGKTKQQVPRSTHTHVLGHKAESTAPEVSPVPVGGGGAAQQQAESSVFSQTGMGLESEGPGGSHEALQLRR